MSQEQNAWLLGGENHLTSSENTQFTLLVLKATYSRKISTATAPLLVIGSCNIHIQGGPKKRTIFEC